MASTLTIAYDSPVTRMRAQSNKNIPIWIKKVQMMLVTPAQIRAARGLLSWSQQELAAASELSLSSIRRMEGPEGTGQRAAANVEAVRAALEQAGVIFQSAGATPTGGPGVRLKE